MATIVALDEKREARRAQSTPERLPVRHAVRIMLLLSAAAWTGLFLLLR